LAGCLLLAGCGSPLSSAASNTATPTATPPPSATATPIVITATPGAPTPPVTPGPSAQATSADPLTHDPAVVQAHGFMPSSNVAQTPDGFGHTLYAWHGTCQGSADGYCQKMFFFIDATYLGTDTSADSTSITGYQPSGTGTIAVSYANYGTSDPLCCPSGQPVTINYYWNGRKLIASGTPPGH
jgi:hypothetical protein